MQQRVGIFLILCFLLHGNRANAFTDESGRVNYGEKNRKIYVPQTEAQTAAQTENYVVRLDFFMRGIRDFTDKKYLKRKRSEKGDG